MRNGKCSKCGSATVVSLANGVVAGGRKMYMLTGGYNVPVEVVTFLCTTCGYHENYISDAKKLSEAAQKWPKVPVT
jgi:hypothetical protein